MKRNVLLALVLILMCMACFAQADTLYRYLEPGCAGDDVLAMKERLYDLGYYTTTKLTQSYTNAVSDVIKEFQKNNGLAATGDADAYTQAVMFSDAAVKKNGQPMVDGASKPAEGTGGDGQYRELALVRMAMMYPT